MTFGLTPSEFSLIETVFKKHVRIREVRIFGSRAQGTQEANSDIDIALFGDIDQDLLGNVVLELDELPLPYIFDVTNYKEVKHQALKQHIDVYGKVLYRRTESEKQFC
ncbi:MAG: nucleotidyltransferase domain-containing protein [Myxococcota bacterium]|nr:nucleotidyltransferase domain-containing protein [Myxococcota bacterium]